MKGALDVHRTLLGRDIPHEIVRLSRAIVHAEQLPEVLGLASSQCVVVHGFMVDGDFVALALPAAVEVDRPALARVLSASKIRPATASETNQATDCAAGLVCPVVLPTTLPLIADARLGAHPVVYTATGDTGTALGIPTGDLLVTSHARVVSLEDTAPSRFQLDRSGTRERAAVLVTAPTRTASPLAAR